MVEKPPLSLVQILNMSVGFFGIQFGWGLQMGNMSPIYECLNADESKLPILWLAAPLTGLFVQPLIGMMSDRTWHPRWGRRRPYFLAGAILASLALVAMPHSSALWMAAGLLWILDASVNVSMEPFRAFVADLLPERQRNVGFAMQSVFIGAGAVIASLLPKWLHEHFGVNRTAAPGEIPQTIHVAFLVGAVVFLAAVLWTVLTTREYPPEEGERPREHHGMREIFDAIRCMPRQMVRLSVVQFFTWMGFFCIWIFYPVAVPRDMFGATEAGSELYQQGVSLANECFAAYNFTAFVAALVLVWLGNRLSAKWIHFGALLLGGAGLLATGWVRDPNVLRWICFGGVGIAWASILSMPYAMLAGVLPENRMGVYMGIFNLFIVLPQILVAIVLSRVMEKFPEVGRLDVVVMGGAAILIAALMTLRVSGREPETSVR